MPNKTKRATIHDVAHHSGVSIQTVSRVVHGDVHVSKQTRQRVLKVIDELNYQPNRAAQSLVTRRSHVLEVIAFGTDYYGPSNMVINIERAARSLGYDLFFSGIPEITPEQIRKAVDSLGGKLVDGMIVITPILGLSYDDLSALCHGSPLVLIDIEQGTSAPSVVIDQYHGGWLATQHLIDLRHQLICEISGPLNWFGARARSQGWRQTMQNAGLEPGLSVQGDWTAVSGYQAAVRLLAEGVPFTGLVVGNDSMALGAISALRERGLRVPEDVSVVGFDDIPESAFFNPPLTTIHQDFNALGKQCVEYLVSLIDQPETPLHQRVLKPQLVVRQSAQFCP